MVTVKEELAEIRARTTNINSKLRHRRSTILSLALFRLPFEFFLSMECLNNKLANCSAAVSVNLSFFSLALAERGRDISAYCLLQLEETPTVPPTIVGSNGPTIFPLVPSWEEPRKMLPCSGVMGLELGLVVAIEKAKE